MLIAGMPAISYLVLYYNPALDTTSAISTIVPGTLALGILERHLAIVIHVSLSVIVFTAVTTGRKYLYPVAIVLHALVDVPAVLYQRQVISGLATVEILTAAESAILAIIAYKMYKKLPEA